MTITIRQKMLGIAIILIFQFLPLKAQVSSTTIEIKPSKATYTTIRYQIDKEIPNRWNVISDAKTLIPVTFEEGIPRILFVQESEDGEHWSKSTQFICEEKTQLWEPIREGLYLSSLDIHASYHIPIADTLSCYKMLIGGGAKINIGVGSNPHVSFVGAVDYHFGLSDTVWVNLFYDISTSFGVGYTIPITHSINIIPQLIYGPVIHIVDMNDGEEDRLYIDQMIKLSSQIVFQISQTLSITMSPYGAILVEKDEFGFLAGIQSGIRILY